MRYIIVFVVSLLVLAGCESDPPKVPFSELDFSLADAGSGEKLFNQSSNGAPTCVSCHALDGSKGIGPPLDGIAGLAGSRVNGQRAEEYLYLSIVRPAGHLVGGFSNVMYAEYEDAFEPLDIADLIAYLMSLE